MTEPAPLPVVKRPGRPPRIAEAVRAQIIRVAAKGYTRDIVAARTGVSASTVDRVLDKPGAQKALLPLARRLGIDKQALRERTKEILAQRLAKTVTKACDVVDDKLKDGDARDANFAMQVVERLDKVSGNTVGEGTRVIHEGMPVPQAPQVALQVLIQQVLGR